MTADRDNYHIQINVRERAMQKFIDEMIHSALEYEILLVKTVMLVNGGAAVALLAFIASVWTLGLGREIFILLILALISFFIGIIFAGRSVLHSFTSHNSFITGLINNENTEFFGIKTHDITDYFYKTSQNDIRWSFRLFAFGVFLSIIALIVHFYPPIGELLAGIFYHHDPG